MLQCKQGQMRKALFRNRTSKSFSSRRRMKHYFLWLWLLMVGWWLVLILLPLLVAAVAVLILFFVSAVAAAVAIIVVPVAVLLSLVTAFHFPRFNFFEVVIRCLILQGFQVLSSQPVCSDILLRY